MDIQPADGADKSGLVKWTLAYSTYSFGVGDIIVCIIRRSGLTTGSLAVTSADLHVIKGQFGSREPGSL